MLYQLCAVEVNKILNDALVCILLHAGMFFVGFVPLIHALMSLMLTRLQNCALPFETVLYNPICRHNSVGSPKADCCRL